VSEATAFLSRSNNQFDLILIDIMLPDGDGFKLCANIQSGTYGFNEDETSVVFLTAKGEISDKVLGFSLGADDYIVKPFDPIELKARVQARLKKAQKVKLKENILTKEGLELNVSMQKVTWSEGAKHEDHVFTRDQVIDAVWGAGVHILDRTIDTHISNLRKKLSCSRFTVRSVHGVGYRFTRQDKKLSGPKNKETQQGRVVEFPSGKSVSSASRKKVAV
jgi:two-component system phosphate regulon response regulator PhoB